MGFSQNHDGALTPHSSERPHATDAGPPGANQCVADGAYAPPGAEFCPEYGYSPEPASRARQYAAHPDDEVPFASLCLGSWSAQHPAAAQKQCEGAAPPPETVAAGRFDSGRCRSPRLLSAA